MASADIQEVSSTPYKGYIEAIGENWPDVECYTLGTRYEDLVWFKGDPLPSKEELDAYLAKPTEKDLEALLLSHLNAKAMERGWDSIYSAALRASYSAPYQEEGRIYATWMDECWSLFYELFPQGIVTLNNLLSLMPELNLQPCIR